ncbi:DUF4270 domain-containing protein [Aquimarina sp. 2201CG5-10]|uniref:DUF4270 domain-containing protein n=1 Tax=Aquimarina callyspongiae TaxID=3098150 RepID=UPI002AB4FE33|nr:DUF4270 domain-containing protein [Aquimarina sp. 2201CG5-10]MDY8135265.1 DUF4270 domain-containing protein [Aquimarina sp. 2201CG5-10]
MNLRNILIKISAIVVVIFAVASCDDDFNSVGSEIIGGVNFTDEVFTVTPVAYTRKFDRVQTSGLPNNLLGVYNDPAYGQSVYSILSQIQPERFDPDFGENAVLDSVVLSIPYFNRVESTETTDEGETITNYVLDSIYGTSPIKLSVYQSNYFLNDFDPDSESEQRQVYFSNDITDNFGMQPEGTFLGEIPSFVPSADEIILLSPDGEDEDTDPEVTKIAPQIRLLLPVDHFKTQILDKEGMAELSNANNFFNYFRGIYFKAEAITPDGNLVFFNISNARLTLFYTFDKVDTQDEDEDGDITDFVEDNEDFEFTFANNIVNSIDNNFSLTIPDPDVDNGDENLYLKGGEGSYAVIDLFKGTDGQTQLDFLRDQDWLINEASIKAYINQDIVVSGEAEPERVYIYNLETGAVLIDYLIDGTQNDTSPVNSKINHLNRISRDADDNGEFYKIRMTQHIINILNNNTENVPLGLSVSQNVNITNNANGFTPTSTEDESIPFSSIISHEGTIIYGNGANVPESKRLKLEIFYTESNN